MGVEPKNRGGVFYPPNHPNLFLGAFPPFFEASIFLGG